MTNHLTRRTALTAAIASLAAARVVTTVAHAQGTGNGRLVVYLSRSGNTRVLAGALSRQFDADLFELRPATPWPADYDQMVAWATDLREQDADVPLAEDVDLASYGTVFLGFPIWGGAMSGVMASFLRRHDLSGKTIIPFITHGGYGEGSAPQALAELASGAEILPPFVLECDQERNTLRQLDAWTEGLPL